MNPSISATSAVQAELRVAAATAQIVRFDLSEPFDHIKGSQDKCWLDLCLTPRPPDAQGSYPERWGTLRFERIGEVLLIPPQEVFRVKAAPGRQTSIVCQLDPELISKWFEGELEWNDWRLEAAININDASIRGMLLRLTRELIHPAFASDILLELMAAQLAIELGRYCASRSEPRVVRGLAAWRLRIIDERVNQLGKAPSLAELAELCNISVRQLSRGFRISRGCSIGQYVEQRRIENAKRLLMSGKSAKTVAYSMGFSSPSSFSYAFRRATGASPGRFRNLV